MPTQYRLPNVLEPVLGSAFLRCRRVWLDVCKGSTTKAKKINTKSWKPSVSIEAMQLEKSWKLGLKGHCLQMKIWFMPIFFWMVCSVVLTVYLSAFFQTPNVLNRSTLAIFLYHRTQGLPSIPTQPHTNSKLTERKTEEEAPKIPSLSDQRYTKLTQKRKTPNPNKPPKPNPKNPKPKPNQNSTHPSPKHSLNIQFSKPRFEVINPRFRFGVRREELHHFFALRQDLCCFLVVF